jgi:hypothetical protein
LPILPFFFISAGWPGERAQQRWATDAKHRGGHRTQCADVCIGNGIKVKNIKTAKYVTFIFTFLI